MTYENATSGRALPPSQADGKIRGDSASQSAAEAVRRASAAMDSPDAAHGGGEEGGRKRREEEEGRAKWTGPGKRLQVTHLYRALLFG